jgi:hypothetical protein
MKFDHLSDLTWRKSSYSSSNAQCVEVAMLGPDVAVRDSKDPGGPFLIFTADEWRAFIAGMVAGQFET